MVRCVCECLPTVGDAMDGVDASIRGVDGSCLQLGLAFLGRSWRYLLSYARLGRLHHSSHATHTLLCRPCKLSIKC